MAEKKDKYFQLRLTERRRKKLEELSEWFDTSLTGTIERMIDKNYESMTKAKKRLAA